MSAENHAAEMCPQCGGSLPARAADRLVCPWCGASLVRVGEASFRPDEQDLAARWGVCLKKFRCGDPQTGMVAFEMLLPADWQTQGGVMWAPNNPAMPATIALRAFNPQGVEAIEIFPSISCVWNGPSLLNNLMPTGMNYMGSEVRPPAPATEVLRDLVVPRCRQGLAGLQMLRGEPLPDLAAALAETNPAAGMGNSTSDGGRLRIAYQLDGSDVEEDVFGIVTTTPLSTSMFAQSVFWVAEGLFGFRARQGMLEHQANNFMSSIRSFRLNPQWFQQVMQISAAMTGQVVSQIQQTARISRMTSSIADQFSHISETISQTDDIIASGYEHRQEMLDGAADHFSQAIRGVNEYQDPYSGMGVELPGGYDHAWSNALGEYIVSDVADFDPNQHSNVEWQSMRQM